MRRLQTKPLAASTIQDILANNPSNKQQQPAPQPIATPVQQPVVLQKQIEFDTLHPEENIKLFLGFARNVISKYEGNQNRQQQLEQEQQDVEHIMELTNDKDVVHGYKLYKKLTMIRRERRACKNEIDLLKPLYDYLTNNNVMNDLSRIQGSCRVSKETISKRQYTLRTDIL